MKLVVLVISLLVVPVNAAEEDTCLQCHGNRPAVPPQHSAKIAPLLPKKFSADWLMYEFASKHQPPLSTIPTPHEVLRGTTHYDWDRRSMTEIYHDKCIDIFPTGRDYRCQFTSIEDKTYLMRFAATGRPTCCLWSKGGFHAPRPDVIRNMAFDRQMNLDGKKVNMWLLDIPLPGPFGYGFTRNTDTPAVFWFPVISGWVQQNFKNVVTKEPDAMAFELIKECLVKTLEVCQ